MRYIFFFIVWVGSGPNTQRNALLFFFFFFFYGLYLHPIKTIAAYRTGTGNVYFKIIVFFDSTVYFFSFFIG